MTEPKSPREIAETLARHDSCCSSIDTHQRDADVLGRWPICDCDHPQQTDSIEQALLSYAAERERLLAAEIENLRCDADNDASKLAAYKRGIAERHELLRAAVEWFDAQRPVVGPGTLPTWYSDASARLRSRPATEGKREDE